MSRENIQKHDEDESSSNLRKSDSGEAILLLLTASTEHASE